MKVKAFVLIALVAVAAATIVGVIAAKPAGATPNKQRDCSQCHGDGTYAATVTATPSPSTVAPSATYSLSIGISENPNGAGFGTGYWIANSTAAGATGTSTTIYGGDSGSTSQSYSRTMTAPAAPGTYYYKVFGDDGLDDSTGIVGFQVYSITVAAPVHDVAVETVVPYPRKRPADVGETGSVVARYANRGDVSETFTATVSLTNPGSSTSVLDTRSITLAAGATITVYYTDVVAYSSAGTWTLTATAGPVAGETATADNTSTFTRTVSAASAVGLAHGVRIGLLR